MIYISVYLGSNKGQEKKEKLRARKKRKRVFWCFFKEAWEGEYNFLLLPSGLILYISISQNHSMKIWFIFPSLRFYVKSSLVNSEWQNLPFLYFWCFVNSAFQKFGKIKFLNLKIVKTTILTISDGYNFDFLRNSANHNLHKFTIVKIRTCKFSK